MTARTTLARDQEVCTAADIDAVRYEVARADVLADAAMRAFDVTIWREAPRGTDRLRGALGLD